MRLDELRESGLRFGDLRDFAICKLGSIHFKAYNPGYEQSSIRELLIRNVLGKHDRSEFQGRQDQLVEDCRRGRQNGSIGHAGFTYP
jgi:hypothetical protein